MLWVSEYGRIHKAAENRVLPDGDLALRQRDFDSLLDLLHEAEAGSEDLEPVFRHYRSRGRDVLAVQHYVGVIRTESGTQIEVLPKVAKNMATETARALLVKMLIELRNSPFLKATNAELMAHSMPLFEILFRQFLIAVGGIIRRGVARSYVSRCENLSFLRGKLQLAEHIRRNAANQARVYCEYDEYEANRPINRLIRGALDIVAQQSTDATNQQACREYLYWFDEVPSTAAPDLDFRRVRHDRLVQHYRPAMPLCWLILKQLNPLTAQGDRRVQSMLFSMHEVFEDYVLAKLAPQLPGWQVRGQTSSRSLVESHAGRPIFRLIPDIELARGTERVVADTKWKLLEQHDRPNKYGISQADIYQLFAYTKKQLASQTLRRAILIYPRTDSFTEPLAPFWYEESREVLYVLPFDLEQDVLLGMTRVLGTDSPTAREAST